VVRVAQFDALGSADPGEGGVAERRVARFERLGGMEAAGGEATADEATGDEAAGEAAGEIAGGAAIGGGAAGVPDAGSQLGPSCDGGGARGPAHAGSPPATPAPVAELHDIGRTPTATVRTAALDVPTRPGRRGSAGAASGPGEPGDGVGSGRAGSGSAGAASGLGGPGDGVGSGRAGSGRVGTGGARTGSGPADTAARHPAADDLPPDAPLPRGRRRGRLGPDAPDPELPEPEADPVAVAREICLRLLTERARTRQELAQALARKGVPPDAAATVLERFDEVGLIDDAAFAGQWVRSRHTHRGLGRRAIAVELRRKGVADDVAGEALAEVDAEAEARRARELVDRKLRSLPVDTADRRAATARRLVGMLARKGYGAGTAYRVVREALAEYGAEVDELDAAEPADD
jgi:regulatory protein